MCADVCCIRHKVQNMLALARASAELFALLQHVVLTHFWEHICPTLYLAKSIQVTQIVSSRQQLCCPISNCTVLFLYPCIISKMNFRLLLIFGTLAKSHFQESSAGSCPDLCACSFGPLGAEVECSGSSLTRFPLYGLPSDATRLSILSASISSVTATHLGAVPLLKSLQLYHSKLAELSPDVLEVVPRLHMLDLIGNQLVLLPPDVFRHAALRSLVLKDNQIVKTDANWFPDNSSLAWLDLSGNRLTDLHSGLLDKLPNLENLDLSDNRLQGLQPEAFKSLRHLKMLNLARNRLRVLTAPLFAHNLNLSQLFLQENQLQELPENLLRGVPHLELLLLSQNLLQRLPPGLLDRHASLRLTLSGNPWLCNDKMVYFWRWLLLHPQNVLFLEEVVCAGPEALRHRKVASLMHSELGLQLETGAAEVFNAG